ncbi:MAG: hypothetical protein K6G29_00120 [Clostridiales bacterium]|nr:hypothetical protein [Clostridiales bacterium]
MGKFHEILMKKAEEGNFRFPKEKRLCGCPGYTAAPPFDSSEICVSRFPPPLFTVHFSLFASKKPF